jgi:hypothetical protein
MSSGEAALLDYCTLDPDPPDDTSGATHGDSSSRTKSDFINRWKEWERTLRLNLARTRAINLRRDTGDAPESPPDAVAAAKAALAMDSPLEAEIFLDKARWDAIESFQGINIFSESAMYAYLLKLLIMERRMAFDVEVGFEEYKWLYSDILGLQTSGEAK